MSFDEIRRANERIIPMEIDELFKRDNDPRDVILDYLAYMHRSSDESSSGAQHGRLPAYYQVNGYLPFGSGISQLIFSYFIEAGFAEELPYGAIGLTEVGLEFHDNRFADVPGASAHVLAENPPPWPSVGPRLEMALKEQIRFAKNDPEFERTLSDLGAALVRKELTL